MEKVRDHPFVVNCEEAHPLIIEALTFLYDLDMISSREIEVSDDIPKHVSERILDCVC